MDADDEALFSRWRAGAAEAGDILARRHYYRVLRFFEYRTGQAAEDLTQRTFAACAANLHRYRGEGTFRAYLFGIARNLLLKFHRDRRDVHELSRLDADDQPRAHTGLSTLVARRDEQRILLQALVAMPEPLQTALVLFYWEGLRAREIAATLDCSTSTVTTRLVRAREVLREHIEELAGSGAARNRLVADVDAWLRSMVSVAPD